LSAKSFIETLKGESELEITVKGRRTGKTHSIIVWFVQEGDKICLLPVKGSDTNWYRNVLKDPGITLAVGKRSLQAKAKPITEPDHVRKVVESFAKKYGGISEIKRWYSKLDVAIEIPLV